MGKSVFKKLGSTLAHIQDLFDTVVYGLINSSKKRSESSVVNYVRDAEKSYYKTYESIKREKGQS